MLFVALATPSSPSCVGTQGLYEEAGPLYERAFAIVDKALGPDHPAVAAILNSRAELELSRVQVRAARETNPRIVSYTIFWWNAALHHPLTIFPSLLHREILESLILRECYRRTTHGRIHCSIT